MPRHPRPPVPAWAQPHIDFYRLAATAAELSPRTIEMTVDVVGWFAGWLNNPERWPKINDWSKITKEHLLAFFVWLREQAYAQGYRHNAGTCLQQFWKWYAEEEDIANPFDKVKPPPRRKLGSKPPPVIEREQLAALIADAERDKKSFEDVRDAALLRLFAATGCRLSEIALMQVDDLDMMHREATVTGKGRKTRTVSFDVRTALALKRYLLFRAKRPAVIENALTALWIGVRRRTPMTPSGVRQIVERRGERIGIDIHPHLFRHTFADQWLDRGGAEGDLDELMGWESPQMRALYGRSVRARRARRHYDQIMGGI